MNRVAVLGSGVVGQVLADGFLKHGYEVMRGSRGAGEAGGLEEQGAGADASVGTFADAARFGELVVLAVKGTAAEAVVDLCGQTRLPARRSSTPRTQSRRPPPVNGVLQFFTRPRRIADGAAAAAGARCALREGLLLRGQRAHGEPAARRAARRRCSSAANDAGAKAEVKTILDQFGWETRTWARVEAARAIEPLCILWCIPGFLQNRWTHAFKLLVP